MTRRRALLAGVAAAFIAGCTGGGDGGSTPTETDGGDDDDGSGGGDGSAATPTATPTATETEDDGGGLSRITESATETGDRDRDRDREDGKPTRTPTRTPTERRGTPEGSPDVILDGRITIADEEWRRVGLIVDEPVTLEYSFRTMRLSIDTFLMTEAEYELFEENERLDYDPDGSVLGSTEGEVVTDLAPLDDGHYVLVFDNTDRGEAGPNRNATVDDQVSGVARVVLYE